MKTFQGRKCNINTTVPTTCSHCVFLLLFPMSINVIIFLKIKNYILHVCVCGALRSHISQWHHCIYRQYKKKHTYYYHTAILFKKYVMNYIIAECKEPGLVYLSHQLAGSVKLDQPSFNPKANKINQTVWKSCLQNSNSWSLTDLLSDQYTNKLLSLRNRFNMTNTLLICSTVKHNRLILFPTSHLTRHDGICATGVLHVKSCHSSVVTLSHRLLLNVSHIWYYYIIKGQ